MSSTIKLFSIVLALLMINPLQMLLAQDKLPEMDDYRVEMLIGSDTYQYDFTNVEGNDCKMKIEEQVTDKKGAVETHSWIIYLSDMDPSKLSFKAKGKSLVISMETNQSQKFISYFEEGEIDGYTHEIGISMNEVDMVRTFLETLKQKIKNCENSQTIWGNRDEAFSWLENNVGKASAKELQWDQRFQQGNRDYLVDFEANSVNGKGEQEKFKYSFDLTDIDPLKMNLRISGTSLMLEIPVKEGKRFISVETPAGIKFTDEMPVYSDDIESARQTFNALKYVITNTSYERPQWDSYNASMGFLKEQLGDVQIGDKQISNNLDFDTSPYGLADFTISTSESEGSPEAIHYAFYLTDLSDKLKLEVSKSITLKLETKEKHEFIRVTKDGKITDYTAGLSFNVADIDIARDIVSAFEFAIQNSEEKIEEYSDTNGISSWFSEHVGAVEIDGNTYQQKLSIDQEKENQMILEKKLVKSDGTGTETKYILYPEDISLDKLNIKVSGKKLYTPLITGSNKYIKSIENSEIQDFTASVEILFSDPLEAKNFMAAIRFLKEIPVNEERLSMSKEEALNFLSGNNQSIKQPAEQYEQKLETVEEANCKMSFTRVELNDKKPSIEYLYEFAASDISPTTSKISVKGEIVSINLLTVGNAKLIKPYKNGEAGDFVDDFIIYTNDVLLAKKTLAAFAALAEGCK
jgi:hypothetical protein